MKDYNMTFY